MTLYGEHRESPSEMISSLTPYLTKFLVMPLGLILLLPIGFGSLGAAIVTDFPLEPPDTSSPRATMDNFLSNMQEAQRQFSKAWMMYEKDPGWYPPPPVIKEFKRFRVFFIRAGRTLNLSEIPPTLSKRVRIQSTVLLKTIFDRISLPSLDSIPDADDMIANERSRWRIPHTDLTIAQVQQGPRKGEFLFSPATIDRLDDDYEQVKHLPHKPGGWVGVYNLYTQLSGDLIPNKLIKRLPDWAKIRFLMHPAWKWMFAAVVLIIISLLLIPIFRFSRIRPQDSPVQQSFRKTLLPLSLVVAGFLLDFLQNEIGFRGDISEAMTTVLLVLTFLGAGWTILSLGNFITERVIASPGIRTKGLDAAMIRVVSRIIGFALAAWVIFIGTQILGIPLTPVVAGLGVGGLTIALSAKTSIENFIGGMTLFADRPVRLGEMCKFGDRMGIVEEIGVRSTRLRTLDRTLVTVPNAEFSKLHLENFTKRDKIWFHPQIHLRLDTTPDQLRYILVNIRTLLYAHPKVLRDPARIRFVEFGTSSLDLDIFAYINSTDYGEYLEITEDLNMRMMDIVSQAGTRLALPSLREYEEQPDCVDEDRVGDIESEVRAWRESNTLYLPIFPDGTIDDLAGTLTYPPPGAPRHPLGEKT